MKKAFAAAGTLFIAAIIFISACFALVSRGAEAVSLSMETLSGDAGCAEGIEIELTVESADCLYWDITAGLSENAVTDAEFSFVRNPGGYSEYSYDTSLPDVYLYFSFLLEGALYGDDISYEDLEENGFACEAIEAVAEKTGNGEAYSEIVRLADYYDYFPLYGEGSVYDPEITGETTSYFDSVQLSALLAEYFAIPVPDDYYIEIYVEKDKSGNITETVVYGYADLTSYNALSDEYIYAYLNGPYTNTVYTQQGILFALSAYSDKLYDFDSSGGYGIWLLEFSASDESQELSADSISLVYEVDPEECEILNVSASEDGSELFLAAIEDGYITVTVIDAETFTQIQKIYAAAAGDYSGELDYAACMSYGSNCLVFQCAEGFITLYYDEVAGEYESMFFPMSEDEYVMFFSSLDLSDYMYYDGKLAIAVSQFTDEAYADFILGICDEDGLEYAGLYTLSIDEGEPSEASCILDISFAGE